jgi:3-hydroxy-3-methylglutaryl CoA synthase
LPKVGIGAMCVYVPPFHVDSFNLAVARKEDPKRFTERVGIKAFAIPGPNEG